MKKYVVCLRTFYYVLLFIVCLYGINFGADLGRVSTKEYKLIKHPINSEIRNSASGRSSIHLLHSEKTEALLKYYEEELKRNGWEYVSTGERGEFSNKKSVGATGRIIHYFVFTKGDLKLAISFIPNSYNQVSDYDLEMTLKELTPE